MSLFYIENSGHNLMQNEGVVLKTAVNPVFDSDIPCPPE